MNGRTIRTPGHVTVKPAGSCTTNHKTARKSCVDVRCACSACVPLSDDSDEDSDEDYCEQANVDTREEALYAGVDDVSSAIKDSGVPYIKKFLGIVNPIPSFVDIRNKGPREEVKVFVEEKKLIGTSISVLKEMLKKMI